MRWFPVKHCCVFFFHTTHIWERYCFDNERKASTSFRSFFGRRFWAYYTFRSLWRSCWKWSQSWDIIRGFSWPMRTISLLTCLSSSSYLWLMREWQIGSRIHICSYFSNETRSNLIELMVFYYPIPSVIQVFSWMSYQ